MSPKMLNLRISSLESLKARLHDTFGHLALPIVQRLSEKFQEALAELLVKVTALVLGHIAKHD